MDSAVKKYSFRDLLKFVSTVISWTLFTLLIMCAILLVYYFVSTQLYAFKGEKFAPKFSLYTIMSGSMLPNIEVYDVIVNTKVNSPDDLEIGDVITFTSISPETMGTTITHRIISIVKEEDGSTSYVTKGDNNLIQDSTAVPYANVIGKVSLKIPLLGQVQVFVAQRFGWLLLLLFPALYILFKDQFKKYLSKGVNVDEYVSDPLLDVIVDDDLPDIKGLKSGIPEPNVFIFEPTKKVKDDEDDIDI